MNSRRNFIKQTTIGLASALAGSSLLNACIHNNTPYKTGPLANIGLQLYTLRDLIVLDPNLALETIAKLGYNHVETYGLDVSNNTFWNLSADELKKVLQDNNLETFSGHYELSKYLSKDHKEKESIEQYMEVALKLGQKYIIAPTTPMFDLNKLTVSDYQYAADQLNKAGEITQKAGIKIAYHNHFWEFRSFPNGTKGLDILLAFTDPTLVSFQLDLFWIEKAGFSPNTYFNKYPNRFHLWHVKDMDRQYTKPIVGQEFDNQSFDNILKEVKYTEIGTGAIDFQTIALAQKESGLEFAYIEQDDIYLPNKFDSIKKSYDYVQKYLTK